MTPFFNPEARLSMINTFTVAALTHSFSLIELFSQRLSKLIRTRRRPAAAGDTLHKGNNLLGVASFYQTSNCLEIAAAALGKGNVLDEPFLV